jgi:hypothetical protein
MASELNQAPEVFRMADELVHEYMDTLERAGIVQYERMHEPMELKGVVSE